ncbi:MAG: phosphatase PAP2 family protein [Candidatus Hydrogenedentota bacterium]|nr:MAG: phosphatase PAP2 family protein [Candidatus Hydrogenedentota bacterium]
MRRLCRIALPSDVINLSFVCALLVLTLAFTDRVQSWYLLVPLYLSMFFIALWLVYSSHGNPRPSTSFLRRWYPLAFIAISFFSLSEIVHHVLPYDIDAQLIAFDYAVFGVHPTVFLSRFLNPYLVDVLELCYASFYWLPIILAFHLYFRHRMHEFEIAATSISLGFYLSYIGNLLFPVRGPYYTLEHLHTIPVEGAWVGNYVREFLFALEPYEWDCFPSGHVAVTLIVVILCYRYVRWLFWVMLPVAAGLILSTVFLQHHYVVDILAGAALAGVVVVATDFIQKLWSGRIDDTSSDRAHVISKSGL